MLNNSPAVYQSVSTGGSATKYSYSVHGKDERTPPKKKKEKKHFSELYFFRKDLNYIFSLCLSLNNGTHEPAILMRKKRLGVGEERHCVQCSGKRKEAKTIALTDENM